MHEATRRLLGVLLRQLDGFGPQSKSIVVGATNRRQDLDPALLSRFDAAVTFGLPSEANRCHLACHASAGTYLIFRCLAGAEILTRMLKAHADTALLLCTSYSWPVAMASDAGLHADWAICTRRQQIMQQYATHLAEGDIAELARATEGMSGRDLRDIAEQSERRTASKVKRYLFDSPLWGIRNPEHQASP